MKINSAASTSILNGIINKTGKNSTKNIEAEQKEIDNEIQSLQQKKATLKKDIDNIKNDFAPPKPKEELIRPLKDQIQILDSQIQQKQMEKMKLQSEKINENSNVDAHRRSNFSSKNIEDKDNPNSSKEKDKTALKLLKNLITQTGVINKAKIESNSKSSLVLSYKEIASSDVSSTSDSAKSIAEKKRQKDIENAISAYKIMESSGSINYETDMLS